ncbi:MAG: bifunctional riboflavin kinase/FAD synthetase [Bacteroidia bacterium]|nr:bifunctional riboflavin kinase/FAD synthetase [Bacteroidia bacterium]
MKIHHSSADFRPKNGRSYLLTIGTFDGVHVGHRKILSDMRKLADSKSAEVVVLTFFPHPRMVLNGDHSIVQMINTMDEKKQLLEAQGVDHLVIQAFDTEFSELSAEDFVRKVLVQDLKTSFLVIGYDHRFGKGRKGSFELLQKLAPECGFELLQISEQEIDESAISSTRIRDCIKNGKLKEANLLLGDKFTLTGTVVEGDKVGRTIGFPTANLLVEEKYKIIPGHGVYAVRCEDLESPGKMMNAMMNIGVRPTIGGKELRLEVHILDHEGNLYGHRLRLFFKEKIREEMKFDSLEALKMRLMKDEVHCRELFGLK